MPFLTKRKRSRPSSTSGGDEMCTSWYSTDPKHLPPGFTVGSMSVPYPPPYYSQDKSSVQPRKKKRIWNKTSSKTKKSKQVVESTVLQFVPDITRLQNSRALDLATQGKLEEAVSPPPDPPLPLDGIPDQPEPDESVPTQPATAQPILEEPVPDKPVLDCVCPVVPDAPVLDGANNLPLEQPTKEDIVEEPQPSQPQPDAQMDCDPTGPQTLQVATATGSPSQRKRLTFQRSCSMNDLDDFLRHEESPPPKPPRSSKTVKNVRKPRGISFDDTQVAHSSERRPFLTHQPRSHQVLSTRSENRDLAALISGSPGQHKKSQSISKKTLYKPKNVEVLIDTIRTGIDVNTLDEITGNAPIHAIVTGKRRSNRTELLLALLVYGKVKVDLPNRRRMPALHLAVEDGDEMCIRALLTFGADINAIGRNNYTPLDLAMDKGTIPNIEVILIHMGAKTSSHLIRDSNRRRGVVPRLYSFAENMKPPPVSEHSRKIAGDDVNSELTNQQTVMEMYRDLEVKVNQKFSLSASYTDADESPDDAYALLIQQRELNHFNKTLRKSGIGVVSGVEGGSRILFLDGGGIKGLVQLEVLMQLEEATGKKVTDLFDWIVGTSTGGVIALTLVYGKKSLREIFQLYFMMKDRIFSKSKIGFGFNTEVLEEILQEYLDPDIKMTDVTHPKVLISAVKKATTNLELHFFNNCFGDEYMEYPVWKVARYTSATPMFFSECDNYIDGGVICNNPTEYGLTTIQNFFRQQGKKLPIALVVSIGTGVYPAVELGSIDLFLGIQTLTRIKQRTQNLIALLGNALVESEMVATNSQSRCKEQGIPFYRFSPKLKDVIAGSETDNEKLFNMVIQTRIDTREQGMEELVGIFHTIARASHHLAPRFEVEKEEKEEAEKPAEEAGKEESEEKEREEAGTITNLNRLANRFVQLNVTAHSSSTMLSDIEESMEASSKKSYKLRSESSPSVPTKFVIGELATTVSVKQSASESEEEVHVVRSSTEHTTPSESTTTMSEEKSDLDTSSDQSIMEKGSQTHNDEVPSNDSELMQSQNSSVFMPDMVSSNELPALSSLKEEDFGSNLNEMKSPSRSSLEYSSSSSLSKESMDFGEKDNRFSSGNEPPSSATPTLPLVEHKNLAEVQANTSQSSASPPTARQFSSQETLKDAGDTHSVASSCSQQEQTSSFGFEVASEEEDLGEEEIYVDQNPQGQVEDDDEIPDSAVDGSVATEESIPGRDSHSSPISLESPQISGPPLSSIGVGGVPGDVAAAAVGVSNGLSHISAEESPTRDYAAAELYPEAQPSLSECKPHSQIHKLETTNVQHTKQEEMPNHYKLNVQLTPDSQKETDCKFPYRYETEI